MACNPSSRFKSLKQAHTAFLPVRSPFFAFASPGLSLLGSCKQVLPQYTVGSGVSYRYKAPYFPPIASSVHAQYAQHSSNDTSIPKKALPKQYDDNEVDLIPCSPVPGFNGWSYSGPPLPQDQSSAASIGSLPAVIYFALSAQQSLQLDPYNQFAKFMLTDVKKSTSDDDSAETLVTTKSSSLSSSLRVFSCTLPFHGTMQQNESAFSNWAMSYEKQNPLLENFFDRVVSAIDQFIEIGWIQGDACWTAGLSRGGFVASHIAIRCGYIKGVVGFSPVTVLTDLPAFQKLKEKEIEQGRDKGPVINRLKDLSLLNETNLRRLAALPVRYYMGNRDELVGTRNAFDVVHQLADISFINGTRSPPHELIMYCSIGRHGHGTPPDIFLDGANWIKKKMNEKK